MLGLRRGEETQVMEVLHLFLQLGCDPLRAGAFTSGIFGILQWGPGGAEGERYGGNRSYA